MNPQDLFCPNIDCHARGQVGKGNICVHSQAEKRHICHECQEPTVTISVNIGAKGRV